MAWFDGKLHACPEANARAHLRAEHFPDLVFAGAHAILHVRAQKAREDDLAVDPGPGEPLLGQVGAERDLSTALRQPELLAAIDRLLEAGADGNFVNAENATIEIALPGPPELEFIAHVRRLPRAAADGSLALVVLHDTTSLRRAERMRADFVANASHELKTPIAGLAGFIETLRGPARDDANARERFLGIMAEQADRMRRLVCEFYDQFSFGKFVQKFPHLNGTITDLLVGEIFTDKVDKVWAPMESMYPPGKAPPPAWDTGSTDALPDKAIDKIGRAHV